MRAIMFIGILVLMGCGTQKTVTQRPTEPPSPTWVDNRPTSSMYYIGIGVAPKAPESDYRRAAKDNAISDLAGEIQVQVNTQSLLYTLETATRFEQEFRESIRTQSNLDLTDYEMVDSWEDQNYYWVYYRLDRSVWAEKQAERRSVARQLALDFLSKAEAEENHHRFSSAIDYYLRGLQAIEAFWNESNEVEYRGKSILLGNALFAGLTDLLRQTTLNIENNPALEFTSAYRASAEVRATLSPDRAPMQGVPIKTSYSGTFGMVNGRYTTNADGRIDAPINDADRSGKENVFVANVDMGPLLDPFNSDKFMRTLTASLEGSTARKTISYIPPEVFVQSQERNLGITLTNGPIASAITTSLNRKGIRPTPNRNEADLIVEISADTKKNGTAQGFKVAMLTLTVTVRDGATGRELYKTSKSDIKGLNIEYPEAGMNAYENYTKNIESQLMRQLVIDFL